MHNPKPAQLSIQAYRVPKFRLQQPHRVMMFSTGTQVTSKLVKEVWLNTNQPSQENMPQQPQTLSQRTWRVRNPLIGRSYPKTQSKQNPACNVPAPPLDPRDAGPQKSVLMETTPGPLPTPRVPLDAQASRRFRFSGKSLIFRSKGPDCRVGVWPCSKLVIFPVL